jgi:hypothetical protein
MKHGCPANGITLSERVDRKDRRTPFVSKIISFVTEKILSVKLPGKF